MATSTCSGPSFSRLMVSEYSTYVFATLNSQCMLQMFVRFLHFSAMSLSLIWKIFSFKNALLVTIVKAFKCGTTCLVSSLLVMEGTESIKLLNVVITPFTTWKVWLSGQVLVISLIASCTTWCTRMKSPPWSSWKSRSEHRLKLMRISSLSASSKSSSTFVM